MASVVRSIIALLFVAPAGFPPMQPTPPSPGLTERIQVAFSPSNPDFSYESCWAETAAERVECPKVTRGVRPVVYLAPPLPAPSGELVVRWGYQGWKEEEARLAVFEAIVTPTAGLPGDTVAVRVGSLVDEAPIEACEMLLLRVGAPCEELVIPPSERTLPLLTPLSWVVAFRGGRDQVAVPFRIDPPPVPVVPSESVQPPRPEFEVWADRKIVEPGQTVVVTFESRTDGITVETCSITAPVAVACDPRTRTARVVVPVEQTQGSMPLTWELTYGGDQVGDDGGEIPVEVVVQPQAFVVTIQPGAAAPGEAVTLTFTPASKDVRIVGCIAAFAGTAGDECQKSRRWFARTSVPDDAVPGTAVLRWGIDSRTAAGAKAADNGAIDYPVLPRSTVTPATRPARPARPAPDQGPGSVVFLAATEPEAARPGERVVVGVSAADLGVEVDGCRVGFSRSSFATCKQAAGGWSAAVTVPGRTRPGTLPLQWEATGGGGTGGGTIDYEVLGDQPAAAAFSVMPDPATAKPGGKIKLAHTALVDGVDVTGCTAGLAPDAMAACVRTADGWVAELAVPGTAPAGKTKVSWRLTYQQAGEPGAADGLTYFEVLAAVPPEPDFPGLWQLLGRLLLGVVALAAPLALTPVRRRLGRMFGRDRAAAAEDADPADVTAVPLDNPASMVTTVNDRDVPAVHLVSVIPRIDPVLHPPASRRELS
jgi:hypothetical protein